MSISSGTIVVETPESIRWDRTIRNWRWWSVLPMVVPAALIMFVLYPLHYVLWPIGQWICTLSNKLYYFKPPKWVKRLMDWAMKKYPEETDEEH
ncbi:hypothetical protein [Xanthomonas phage X1]|nr:hypothetical protein [Xanthomonas phage X1]